jgi:site-specific DNA recombinase
VTAVPTTLELLEHVRPSTAVRGVDALAPVVDVDAVVYVRISRDRDDGAGATLGVKRQEFECREYAERSLGWNVTRVYVDNDKSAKAGSDRPAFNDLMDDLRAGRIRRLIAWHMDRVARNDKDFAAWMEVCKRLGVVVRMKTSGDVDLTTASGRWMARQLAGAAIYESEHRSERLVAKHDELARDGKPSGGRRRYGYNLDMTVRADEQAVILDCARRLLASESLGSVVRRLNAKRIPTSTLTDYRAKRDAGLLSADAVERGEPSGHWHPETLRGILRSPHIAGHRSHDGDVSKRDAWPPLVDDETWHSLQMLWKSNAETHTELVGDYSTARRWLLPGITRCAVCGGAMQNAWAGKTPSQPQRRRNYRCRDRHCVTRNAEALDLYVTEAVVAVLETVDITGLMADDVEPDSIDGLRARAAEVEAQLDSIADRLLAETLTDGMAHRLTVKAEAEQAELVEAIAKAEAEAREDKRRPLRLLDGVIGPEARTIWETLPLDRQRALIDLLLDVRVTKAEKRGARIGPDAVIITPKTL